MKNIPYGHQSIDQGDIKEVVKVLKSDWITQGPKIAEFEEALCKYTGAKYAVVVSSGTAALHIASLAAGLKDGDDSITSPISFVASANCALYCGAKPIFADVDPETANIEPGEVLKKITGKTRVIIPVDFAGLPCDLEEICKIAHRKNLIVIEDAAHALGAEYKGAQAGSCKYSDMAILSFHPVKSITTGEGGAVLTNDKYYYKKLIMDRQHGVTSNKGLFKDRSGRAGDWYYEMQSLGFNYRLTDIQCALGISQLKKLDGFIRRRKKIVEIYKEAFRDNEYFDLPQEKDDAASSWHLFPIRLKGKYIAKRKEVFSKMREKGIRSQVHYIPVYWQPYYKKLGYKKGICPAAENFYEREISIPLYHGMENDQIHYVIKNIFKIFNQLK